MATENGLEKLHRARVHIEYLRERRAFLETKSIALEIDIRPGSGTYEAREIAAIDWALPILEAEWDNMARLRRNLEHVENRLAALDRRGVEEDHARVDWEAPCPS